MRADMTACSRLPAARRGHPPRPSPSAVRFQDSEYAGVHFRGDCLLVGSQCPLTPLSGRSGGPLSAAPRSVLALAGRVTGGDRLSRVLVAAGYLGRGGVTHLALGDAGLSARN